MARQRGSSAETVETYNHVSDLVRAGLSVKAATAQIAAAEGVPESRVAGRYFKVKADRARGDSATPKQPRRRATDAATIAEPRVADLLETAALMIGEAAKGLADLERDAANWRNLRGMIDAD